VNALRELRWAESVFGTGPIAALALMIAAVLVALVLEWLHRTIFRRLATRTSSTYDDTMIALLHRPIRNTVLLAGFAAAVSRIGWDPAVVDGLRRATLSVVVILWAIATSRAFSLTFRRLAARRRVRAVQPATVPLFDTVQKVLITGLALYVGCLVWNVDVTAWLASAGIVGIAVGFAAKDTLANLFSGVFILVDAPYRIGDMIVFDTGERGRVTNVGIRSTRILTRDDVEITIPNAIIGTAKIVNESGGPEPKRRVDVRVGVSYASDIDLVRRALGEVAAELELACADPAPRVRFREMADSSLVFSLLFWIEDPEARGQAVDEANTKILARFRREGIEIPFPQRVVHWPGGRPAD
jgi:small-conductance mechanosensitive channel